jgi:TatD DNase family protein
MLVDAHLHLDAPAFDADRGAVLARAEAAGVGLMVSAGTSLEGSRQALALAERYPRVRAAVGVHPESADRVDDDALEALGALARHPRVVAIGEVGLDYVRARVARPRQVSAFRAQVRLAVRAGLPVVVHDREAHEDVERILREEGAVRVVCHCFSGPPETAVRWAEAGWTISLAGPLTFAHAGSLRDVARRVPPDRLLVETDAPYLAPAPMRGRRCEPAFLVHTVRALAELRGVEYDRVEAILERNARAVFGVPEERATR